MSTTNIVRTAQSDNGDSKEIFRGGVVQNVTVSGTSAVISNGVGTTTGAAILSATTNCYYAIGSAPVATTSDFLLPLGVDRIVVLEPAEKIAFIQVTAGGIASVIELEGREEA